MDPIVMMLSMLLWSTGLQDEIKYNQPEPDDVRLVGGTSRCAGELEMKHQGDWKPMSNWFWNLMSAAVVCRQLDCGSAFSTGRSGSTAQTVRRITADCNGSESALRECRTVLGPSINSSSVEVICSESVRLVKGSSRCSGRVEVKSNQSWSSVCEDDFDQQDAEVVCRELGCGAPSVLQGALYGEVEAPVGTKEFQCEGSESLLLECGTSGSDRNTCSPGNAVGLTCSEPDDVRLVGGASRCAGELEMKHQGDWKPVEGLLWDLMSAAVVCRQLNCGSAVSTARRSGSTESTVWGIIAVCNGSESVLRECGTVMGSSIRSSRVEVICSESVRLVKGSSRCSGRVEVKSNQSWSSVCEDDFDQQDAEVVCRELGCGAPSVLQGALYGEVKAAMGTKEFQCEGSESLLLDCGTSGSDRNTCSPGKAVGLICSEPDDVRLVGGASRCGGGLEMKHQGDWNPVLGLVWNLMSAAVVCRQLNCGSVISTGRRNGSTEQTVWGIIAVCDGSESALRECGTVEGSSTTSASVEVICSAFPKELITKPVVELPILVRVILAQLILVLSITALYFYCKATRGQRPGRVENIELESLGGSSRSIGAATSLQATRGQRPRRVENIELESLGGSSRSVGAATSLQATRGQRPGREGNIELESLGGSNAEDGPGEEAGAQGPEEDL